MYFFARQRRKGTMVTNIKYLIKLIMWNGSKINYHLIYMNRP